MIVLITGSSGMLGRALTRHLKKEYSILGLSRQAADDGLRCDLADAPSLKKIFDSNKIDFVINTAAYSDVDGCERDPKAAYDANALPPKNLAALCGAKGIPWIQVSTDYVFDGRKKTPYLETDRTLPINNYGQTKSIGEFYALRSASPSAVVRTSWLFGETNPKTFVDAIAARLKTEETMGILDDQIDSPTSVKDLSLALGIIAAYMLKLPAGKRWNETYHVCNQGEATRLEMARQIRDGLGLKSVKVERADPGQIKGRVAIRPAYVVMDKSRFERTFGMTLRPWQDSLQEYVKTL